jgi:hypothetical protein
MCHLNYIKCTIPTIKGKIFVEIRKDDDTVHMEISIPKDTIAEVYLPLINKNAMINSPYSFTVEDDYAKFVLPSGIYSL